MFAAALCFSISPSSLREDIPQHGSSEEEEEVEKEEEAWCVICFLRGLFKPASDAPILMVNFLKKDQ